MVYFEYFVSLGYGIVIGVVYCWFFGCDYDLFFFVFNNYIIIFLGCKVFVCRKLKVGVVMKVNVGIVYIYDSSIVWCFYRGMIVWNFNNGIFFGKDSGVFCCNDYWMFIGYCRDFFKKESVCVFFDEGLFIFLDYSCGSFGNINCSVVLY